MQPTEKYTLVKFNDDATQAVYEGVREVCEATATTLGPLGRNVLIDKGYEVTILHDGVSVANSINPEEPFKNKGAKVIQEAAKKQRDAVGDGTTAVMILSKAILDESLKITAAGTNPMLLRSGLESGALKVVNHLSTLAVPVTTEKQKIQIATISAEDAELGEMIAKTIHKIGAEGVITVDESKAAETYVETQEGMQIDKGYAHGFMITDPERQTAVLEDVYVLVTDLPLNELAPISKFLETKIFPNTKKVLFISPEIGGDFLTAMLGAKIKGMFLGVAVRAPGIGTVQAEILQDICALTGAKFITKEAGDTFDMCDFPDLGHASRIICSKTSSIIEGGSGKKDDILQRIQVIRAQMEDETTGEFDQEQLKGRLAKLTNGVAVIKVAGQTEIEMKERKERALDAVQATQAACRSGLVPGGEISYLSCLDVLDETILGEKILKNALKAPFSRLVENAGYNAGEILEKLRAGKAGKSKHIWSTESGLTAKDIQKIDMNNPDQHILVDGNPRDAVMELPIPMKNLGFDVTDGKIKDMIKAGIIDPLEVPSQAIRTAVSVAVQLSSLGAAVVMENVANK